MTPRVARGACPSSLARHVYFAIISYFSPELENTRGLDNISINLLVVYRESVNLIGYIARRLSADTLQLWIANENGLF